jgi:hypothetical protein
VGTHLTQIFVPPNKSQGGTTGNTYGKSLFTKGTALAFSAGASLWALFEKQVFGLDPQPTQAKRGLEWATP